MNNPYSIFALNSTRWPVERERERGIDEFAERSARMGCKNGEQNTLIQWLGALPAYGGELTPGFWSDIIVVIYVSLVDYEIISHTRSRRHPLLIGVRASNYAAF
jgi:hypothetical protein